MYIVIFGALVIGLCLGLMGSGGSILTVPILHYVVGQPEKAAFAGSLLIVGCIALFGGMQSMWRGRVQWRSVLWFGLPGMAGTWFGAILSVLVSGTVQLALFDVVMLLAAWFMLRPRPQQLQLATVDAAKTGKGQTGIALWRVVLYGLLVGVLTGFVGVGGGFLIVPALVLLGRLPMHRAIGTSLVIITMQSFSGFVKYLDVLKQLHIRLDYTVLAWFAAIGVLGSLIGGSLGSRVPQAALQRAFAILLLLAGVGILVALLLA